MKPFSPGLLLLGDFSITNSVSVLVIICSCFLYLPGSVSGDFFKNLSSLVGCPVYCCIIAQSNHVGSFVFLSLVVTSPLSFLILFILALSLFLWWIWLMVDQLCLFFPRIQFTVLLIFSFFKSLLHLFLLWPYDLFLSSTLVFFCSFDRSFKCKIRLFIWDLLVSECRLVSL